MMIKRKVAAVALLLALALAAIGYSASSHFQSVSAKPASPVNADPIIPPIIPPPY